MKNQSIAVFFSVCLMLGLSACQVAPPTSLSAQTQAFLGIGFSLQKNLPALAMMSQGLRVKQVMPTSAAAQAGLQQNDVILSYDGHKVVDERQFSQYLQQQKRVGDILELHLLRMQRHLQVQRNGQAIALELRQFAEWLEQQPSLDEWQANWQQAPEIVDVSVVLGRRASRQIPLPKQSSLIPSTLLPTTPLPQAQQALSRIKQHGLQASYEGVLQRFERDEHWDKGWRLPLMRYLHRAPLQVPAISQHLSQQLLQRGQAQSLPELLHYASAILDLSVSMPTIKPPERSDLNAHLAFIQQVLKRCLYWHHRAFRDLSAKEQAFLRRTVPDRSGMILHPWRKSQNQRVLALAKKIDNAALLQASLVLAQLSDPQWLARLKTLFQHFQPRTQHAQVQGELLMILPTALGELLIGGTGANRYSTDALIIDLGGDDLYLRPASSAPIHLVIDMQGNDHYSSNSDAAQGAGVLGIGLLLDLSGHDTYVAQNIAQGAGLFGVGILCDVDGDDRYFSRRYAQGTGVWGLGLLLDTAGQDQYHAASFAQGFGSTHGLGLLLDQRGADRYFATGQQAGSYGQAGVFNGFAQGVGFGLRGQASGGVGLLLDGAGDDEFIAGHFSQGGGYFFAFGLLYNAEGHDRYLGSRYAQGFAAHSAVGALLETGGNDVYAGHVGALQAAAWDLSTAVLWDMAGDDRYLNQGRFFSQAAAAHNGLAWLLDDQGRDEYQFIPGRRIASNDYHGGQSLSLFFDTGGDTDIYNHSIELNQTRQQLSDMEIWVDE